MVMIIELKIIIIELKVNKEIRKMIKDNQVILRKFE